MEPVRGYARSGETNIAYAVFGQGPDVVFLVPFGNPMEMGWEIPFMARYWNRMASIGRIVAFDQRGTGASDPVSGDLTLDDHVADVEAVVEAVGLETFVLMGGSQTAPQAVLYAHRHPERLRSLVLYAPTPRLLRADDWPIGFPPEVIAATTRRWIETWGSGRSLEMTAPTVAGDAQLRALWGRAERTAGTPAMTGRLMETYAAADVRREAAELAVATLVVHRRGDTLVPISHGRAMTELIPDARLVELDGIDHFPYAGDFDALLDETEEWLTGRRGSREQVLTTLLFTDIVGSTERASALGDRDWRRLLERHDAEVRRAIARAGGTELNTAGDGFLSEFPTAGAALRAAREIRAEVRLLGLEVRAGVHTTECERIGDNVGGLGVHVAARVAAAAGGGEILLSRTVADVLVGAGLHLDDRGEHDLKGVPERWTLYALGS